MKKTTNPKSVKRSYSLTGSRLALLVAPFILAGSWTEARGQAALFTYQFNDVSTSSGLTSAGGSIAGATFSSFSVVGNSNANPNATGRFSFLGWPTGATNGSDTFTGSISLTQYYQFTLTPQAGFAVDLNSITFTLQRSGTGIRQYSVRTSSDNYSTNVPASITGTNANLSVVSSPVPNIFQVVDTTTTANDGSTLTFGSSFDSITNALTVRFYGWNAEASGGTFSVDNVAIFGSILLNTTASYWDANGAAGVGGSGTWDTTSPLWNSAADGTGALGTFNSANAAVFAGTAGTVTIGAGGINAAGGLKFQTTGYVIAGGDLTFATIGSVEVADSVQATISSRVRGAAGLTKTGAGTLTLTSANDFTGAVTIGAGTLVASDAALGDPANDIILSGGTLSPAYNAGSAVFGSGRDVSGTGGLVVPAGNTVEFQGNSTAGYTLSNGTADHTSAGTVKLSGSTNQLGATTFNDPVKVQAPNNVTLTGDVTVSSTGGGANIEGNVSITAARRFDIADTVGTAVDFLLNGSFLSGTARVTKVGAGTMRMQGNNSGFNGGFAQGAAGATPTAGGRLEIVDRFGLGNPATPTTNLQFFMNDGALFADSTSPLTGADALPVGVSIGAGQLSPAVFSGAAMEFAGTSNLFGPTGVTAYDHKIQLDTSVTFSNAAGFGLTGTTTSQLSLSGAGTMTVTSFASTFNVPIVVDGPTLDAKAGPTVSAGTVTVKNGKLKAGGTFAGIVAIGDGSSGLRDATLDLVDGAANTLTLSSDANFAQDAVIRLEINSSTASSDKITSVGLSLGNASLEIVDLGSTLLAANTAFTLFTFTGTNPIGTFAQSQLTVGVNTFNVQYGTNDVKLVAVPEPSAAVLTSLVLAGAFGLRRPRRA